MTFFSPPDVRAPHGPRRSQRLHGWRRIANAIWSAPEDPEIYGLLEVDATNILSLTSRAARAGLELTTTHLVGRAVAHALATVPGFNVSLRFGRRVPRGGVSLFFITALRGGQDLGGARVDDAERRPVLELAKLVGEGAERQRRGEDSPLARSKKLADLLPMPLLRVALRAATFASGELGWNIPALGLQPEPFGSAMISSLGSLGLPLAFVPIAWMYRVPLIVTPGTIADKPVAVAGRVEIRPMLPISLTIDHRYVDGAELAGAWKAFRDYLEDPAPFEPELCATLADRPSMRAAPQPSTRNESA